MHISTVNSAKDKVREVESLLQDTPFRLCGGEFLYSAKRG